VGTYIADLEMVETASFVVIGEHAFGVRAAASEKEEVSIVYK